MEPRDDDDLDSSVAAQLKEDLVSVRLRLIVVLTIAAVLPPRYVTIAGESTAAIVALFGAAVPEHRSRRDGGPD